MNKVFISQLNQNRNNVENKETNNQNQQVEVFSSGPIISTLFYICLNIFQIVLGFLLISQSDRSSQIYNVSFYVLNLILLLKHGSLILVLYKFDGNFKLYIHSLFRKT